MFSEAQRGILEVFAHLPSLRGRRGGSEFLYDYVCTHGFVWRESPILNRESGFTPPRECVCMHKDGLQDSLHHGLEPIV